MALICGWQPAVRPNGAVPPASVKNASLSLQLVKATVHRQAARPPSGQSLLLQHIYHRVATRSLSLCETPFLSVLGWNAALTQVDVFMTLRWALTVSRRCLSAQDPCINIHHEATENTSDSTDGSPISIFSTLDLKFKGILKKKGWSWNTLRTQRGQNIYRRIWFKWKT